jgi:DNA-binding SARP family transcriptional activator
MTQQNPLSRALRTLQGFIHLVRWRIGGMGNATLARVSLLGPIEVVRNDGRAVALGTGRQSSVLAVLALRANTFVSTEALVQAVFDPPVPDGAVATLHTYLSRLRRTVISDAERWARRGALSSTGATYRLAVAPGVLDLDVFEDHVEAATRSRAAGDDRAAAGHLDAALALWRGEPLVALPGPAIEQERRRLRERWLAVKHDRLELDVRLGRARQAIGELSALLDAGPLQEQWANLLMIALYRSGRQADALQLYASMRRRLAEELGVSPGDQLRATYLRILRGEPAGLPELARAL